MSRSSAPLILSQPALAALEGPAVRSAVDTQPAYVARKACGCVVMLAVDNPVHAKDTAREIAACILDGYHIERLTVAEAKKLPRTRGFGMCEHDSPEERKKRELRARRGAKQELRS